MSLRLGPAGPRGLAVLAVTAVVGVGLANHGWSNSHHLHTPGSFAGGTATGAASTPAASAPSSPAGPAASPGNSASPGSSASPASSPSASASATPGPLLSSQSFAQYAYLIWPGTRTAAAKAAMTGLSVTVHRQSGGLSVTATVNGQAAGPPQFYGGGARVYIIEATLGDDSGGSDYSLGDDGLVVTDAKGRILQ